MTWFFKSLLLTVLLTSTSVSNSLPATCNNTYFETRSFLVLNRTRGAAENNNAKNVNVGVIEQCLEEMGLKGKKIKELDHEELGELKGCVNAKYGESQARSISYKNDLEKKDAKIEILNHNLSQASVHMKQLTEGLSKATAIPLLREKFGWYEKLWSTGGDASKDLEDVLTRTIPGLLDEQSKSNIKAHANTWDKIFKGVLVAQKKKKGTHPGALRFYKKLQKLFPGLDTAQLSVYIGLTIVRLNNAEHLGSTGNEGLQLMNDPKKLTDALLMWEALNDKDLLNVVEAFQDSTVDRERLEFLKTSEKPTTA